MKRIFSILLLVILFTSADGQWAKYFIYEVPEGETFTEEKLDSLAFASKVTSEILLKYNNYSEFFDGIPALLVPILPYKGVYIPEGPGKTSLEQASKETGIPGPLLLSYSRIHEYDGFQPLMVPHPKYVNKILGGGTITFNSNGVKFIDGVRYNRVKDWINNGQVYKVGDSHTTYASHYGIGDGFDGKLTASGERLNPHAITAALWNIKFNSKVKVEWLVKRRNGGYRVAGKVTVRINDHGPADKVEITKNEYVDISYRGIDLTDGSMKKMIGDNYRDYGVVLVRITILEIA